MNLLIPLEQVKDINRFNIFKYLIFFVVLTITALIGAFSLAQNIDKLIDSDNDGLSDYQEKEIYYTALNNPDTDNDGYTDGEEIQNGYSPLKPKIKNIEIDTDNDGLNDDWEIKIGTDLMNIDTDGDLFLDGAEVENGYSPIKLLGSKVPKRIEVNIKNFTLSYFFDDIKLREFLVSTGKPSTPTPKGTFQILAKVPAKNYTGLPNTKWNLHFTTGKNTLRYFIHGAYWHNLFGIKNVSGGCVNVPYAEMERLYEWTNIGTKVIIE
jgi:hypothetical protein